MQNSKLSATQKGKKLRVGSLALLILIVVLFFFYEEDKADIDKEEFVKVEIGSIEDLVTAQGRLEAREYVDVGAQVSGQLKKVVFELGATVKEGDLLAEIDPEIYAATVRADEANLKTLEAQFVEQKALIEQAELIHERNKKLIESGAISRETFEKTETDLKVARARLESLSARIEEANSKLQANRTNLNYTKIYAPISGTIVEQSAQEGETLNANQTTPKVFKIANLELMTVRAQVAEADISKIKEKMAVYFTTLGSRERRWEGVVRQILPTPDIVADVVLYNVLVDVENKDRVLMSDMSTQMFFVVGSAKNVPIVNVRSLLRRQPDKDVDFAKAYVVRKRDKTGKTEERTVLVGIMSRTEAEIIEGLESGDEILLPNIQDPSDKEKQRLMMPRI